MTTHKIDDWALHAFVDNEVSAEQAAEIEQALRADPELAQKVETWRRQRDLLKQTYDSVLGETLPPSLMAALRNGGSLTARPYFAMAAAVALVVLGGLAGWFMARQPQQVDAADIANDALYAHQVYSAEVRHPVEVKADERDHLQTWLSKRVGTPFTVPDLTAEGYSLLGGRLLVIDGKPAAFLMYEDAKAMRISILLSSAVTGGETALHVEQRGNLTACYWRDGNLAFAVAGRMDRAPMMKLAEAIYAKFES